MRLVMRLTVGRRLRHWAMNPREAALVKDLTR